MAASVMCNFATITLGAISACSHQHGSISFPVKVAMNPTKSQVRVPVASQTVQSCSGVITHDADSVSTVFADVSKGIVCYRSESGEVTCEGPDEGPCFYPHSAQLPQQVSFSSISLPDIQVPRPFSFSTEDIKDICMKEYMGSIFCEGRDES